MEIIETPISGVKLVGLDKRFFDRRGYLQEVWRYDQFTIGPIKQVLRSTSFREVVRGLHCQLYPPRGNLIEVTKGVVYLVSVDMKKSSPTYKKYHGIFLRPHQKILLWTDPHIFKGFYSMSDETELIYYMTEPYNPSGQSQTIKWNDGELDIDWPGDEKVAIVSEADAAGISVEEWENSKTSSLPMFR